MKEEILRLPLDMAETMRSLKEKLQSCREDNEKIIRDQDEHNELNVALLQSLTKIQKQLHQGHISSNTR
jgi:uncharacterized protein YeeX (DUF496 family)